MIKPQTKDEIFAFIIGIGGCIFSYFVYENIILHSNKIPTNIDIVIYYFGVFFPMLLPIGLLFKNWKEEIESRKKI